MQNNPQTPVEIVAGTCCLYICNCSTIIGEWDLMRWIVKKHFEYGKRLTARAVYCGAELRGILRPRSIDRTQTELTRSTLVDLITKDGTHTFNCKYLTHITINEP